MTHRSTDVYSFVFWPIAVSLSPTISQIHLFGNIPTFGDVSQRIYESMDKQVNKRALFPKKKENIPNTSKVRAYVKSI